MTDDRIRRVLEYTEGPTVLDLGAVQHDLAKTERDDWLHDHLVDRFETVVGVDILQEDVQALREQGYTMLCDDVTTMDRDLEADTVVAGELIEHVDNPGGLVAVARDHLKPGGRFVLTTPNPWGLPHLRRWLTGRQSINDEHVAWYGPCTLAQLLERYDFTIDTMETTRRPHRGLTRLAQYLDTDHFAGTTWVAVARKPGGDA